MDSLSGYPIVSEISSNAPVKRQGERRTSWFEKHCRRTSPTTTAEPPNAFRGFTTRKSNKGPALVTPNPLPFEPREQDPPPSVDHQRPSSYPDNRLSARILRPRLRGTRPTSGRSCRSLGKRLTSAQRRPSEGLLAACPSSGQILAGTRTTDDGPNPERHGPPSTPRHAWSREVKPGTAVLVRRSHGAEPWGRSGFPLPWF